MGDRTAPALPGRDVRFLRALAHVVCPEVGPPGLPDRATAAALQIVETLSPASRAAVRALCLALDESTRLRHRHPFSALEPAPAREVVERWRRADRRGPARQGYRLLRDLLVLAAFEEPELRSAVGYEPDAFIAERAASRRARWSDDIARHSALLLAPAPLRPAHVATGSSRPRDATAIVLPDEVPTSDECDVVVVGSGAGGGVVAAELAEAGLSVVVLEEGGHHPTESFTTSTTHALRTLYRESGATSTLGRAPVGYAEGRCVGGGTVVNGGMAFRASPRVLARWSAQCADPGLVQGALDVSYARVERFLSVGLPDAGSAGRDQELLALGAERLGWRVVPNTRDHVHCGGCNVCTWGCPTGAKQSTLVSYLPRARSFGARVLSGCRVDRIEMSGKRAVGVRGRVVAGAEPGRGFRVRARAVVVCAGAVQTPALLQRSGIRPPSRQVGRNLSLHPGASVTAVFDEEVRGWEGAHQTLQVRQFEDAGVVMAAVNLPPSLVARSLPVDGDDLLRVMRDYNHLVTAGVLVEDTGRGRVRAVGREGVVVGYPVTRRDAARVATALADLARVLFAAGARRVQLPVHGIDPVDADGLARVDWGGVRPADLDLSTVHLMGTARMGTDPMWAVCDPFGRVHDTRGLWVADASLFPGPVGINPMLTVMALATRVAGQLVDSW